MILKSIYIVRLILYRKDFAGTLMRYIFYLTFMGCNVEKEFDKGLTKKSWKEIELYNNPQLKKNDLNVINCVLQCL